MKKEAWLLFKYSMTGCGNTMSVSATYDCRNYLFHPAYFGCLCLPALPGRIRRKCRCQNPQ